MLKVISHELFLSNLSVSSVTLHDSVVCIHKADL